MKELIDKVLFNINTDFDLEKELKLKSMIITYLIMTKSDIGCDELIELLTKELQEDEHFRTNSDKYLDLVIENALNNGYTPKSIIHNFITEGYLFHSFNGAFKESIKERGLVLTNKPWDLNETERVKQIFSTKGKKDLYGLYQGEEHTPIYLSSNLNSSSYYAVSSPTWFLHFVTGGMMDHEYDKEAYRRRDYDACLNNILLLIYKYQLSKDEEEVVLRFFNKYYNMLASSNPNMLMIKRNAIIKPVLIPPQSEDETGKTYIKRIINTYASENHLIKQNINKEDIFIIDYVKERKYVL